MSDFSERMAGKGFLPAKNADDFIALKDALGPLELDKTYTYIVIASQTENPGDFDVDKMQFGLQGRGDVLMNMATSILMELPDLERMMVISAALSQLVKNRFPGNDLPH